MVSFRKRYSPGREDAPSVSTPPSGHPRQSASPPPDIPKPEPIEQPTTEPSPADEAAKSAMRARLQETERAAAMEHETPRQPRYAESQPNEPPTAEEIIAATQLPERAKRWLREHSEFIQDPAKNATIIALHDVAKRQAGGEEWTDNYFGRMEELLGMRPEQPRNSNGTQHQTRAAAVRYSGPPPSAPPHRDVPSMRTGRSQNFRAPLTRAEVEIARASGISDGEYQTQKEKIMRMKQAGLHQDG
jgi:hypothetical protein